MQRRRMAWCAALLVVALCAVGTVSAPAATAATTGSLSGRVTLGATPLGGIRVWIYTVPGKVWVGSAITAADGSYSLPSVAPGTYRMLAWASTGAYPAVWYGQAASFTSATDVQVVAGTSLTGIDINLATRGTIAGAAIHAGVGVANVNALLFKDGTFLGGTTTDAAGAYSLRNLMPGGYTLSFIDNSGIYPSTGFWPNQGDAQDAQVIQVEAGVTFVADQQLYTAADFPVDPYTGNPGPHVAVVGDSITQQSSHHIHEAIDPLAGTTVRGISLQRIDDLQPVAEKMAALVPPPDQVIIAAGNNDVIQNTPLDTIQASLLTMIDAFPASTCVTVVNVTTSTANAELNERARIWDEWLASSLKALRPNTQIIDWAAAREAYHLAGNPEGSWTLEGLHLTVLGEAAYANLMREAVLACGAPEASVSGTSYVDGNANGVRESGEPDLAGQTIALTGTDRLRNAVSRSAVTAEDGSWVIDVPAGTYTIAQLPSPELGAAFSVVGTAGGVPTSDGIADVVLDHGAIATGYDFATSPGRSSLSGTVYADLDANGTRDPDDIGIERASIHITGIDSYGRTVDRTTETAADGTWSSLLLPGRYDIAESPGTGYRPGVVGAAGGLTPGPRIVTDVEVGVGEEVAGMSFAEIPLPVGSWATTTVDAVDAVARSVAVGSDGRIAVAGSYLSSVTLGTPEDGVTFTTTGSRAGYLATYDGDGELAWAVNLTATLSAETFKVAVDGDGSIVVVGDFNGSATFGSAPLEVTLTGTGLTGFVASFDPDGALRWAKAVEDSPGSIATGVDVDAAGDVYVTGAFQHTAVFGRIAGVGGTTLTGTGLIDGFIARYTADGSFVTAQPLNSPGGVLPFDVAVSAGGAATVVGMHAGLDVGGGNVVPSAGQLDAFAVTFDATTTAISWARSFGGVGSEIAFGVAVDDPTGTVVLSGGFAASVDFGDGQVLTAADNAMSDGFVLALDAAGATRWARASGGLGSDRGTRLSVGSGHVHVAGTYTAGSTFGAETLLAYGGEDGSVASYDLAGTLTWVRPVGGPGNDSVWGVATAANGDAIAVGSYVGPAAVMPGPLAFGLQGPGAGAFVVRLDA